MTKKSYPLIAQVELDGTLHQPPGTIQLSEEQAADLAARGAIEPKPVGAGGAGTKPVRGSAVDHVQV